jgi:hypothetical protein
MPPRRRPSAQLLSPAGWAGVLTLLGFAVALALAANQWLGAR